MLSVITEALGYVVWYLLLIVEDMLPEMPQGVLAGSLTAANDVVPIAEIAALLPFAGALYGYVAWVKVLKFVRGSG